MNPYIDCALEISGVNQALLRVDGAEYEGTPDLGDTTRAELKKLEGLPKDYGTLLFERTLLPGSDLRKGYDNANAFSLREQKPLRFRVYVQQNAPLGIHAIFWEALYDPKNDFFLGCYRRTPFSRYLTLGQEPPAPTLAGKPRMLVIVSCPSDAEDYNLSPLKREEIVPALEKSMNSLEAVTVDFLATPATRKNILEKLNANHYDAIHVQAHGIVRKPAILASLVLEKEDGTCDFLEEGEFSQLFGNSGTPRLVVLMACSGGAQLRTRDPFSGLGPALLRRGVPAVVAMLSEISISGAALYSSALYTALGRTGEIEVSSNEARNALSLDAEDRSFFPVPALYSRLPTGTLWSASGRPSVVRRPRSDIPPNLVTLLNERRVVAIIGPEITKALLPSPIELARDWAAEYDYCNYNDPDNDRNSFPAVARFVQVSKENGVAVNFKFVKTVRKLLLDREKEDTRKQDVKNEIKAIDLVARVAGRQFDRDSDDPHLVLASLPIDTYITANHDGVMYEALRRVGRSPRYEICPWKAGDKPTSKTWADPAEPGHPPLVFYLFGSVEKPESLALTEDHLLEFLLCAKDLGGPHGAKFRFPQLLVDDLNSSLLLILGFNLRDLVFRVMWKTILSYIGSPDSRPQILCQLLPEESKLQLQSLEQLMKDEAQALNVNISVGSLRDFLMNLREANEARK